MSIRSEQHLAPVADVIPIPPPLHGHLARFMRCGVSCATMRTRYGTGRYHRFAVSAFYRRHTLPPPGNNGDERQNTPEKTLKRVAPLWCQIKAADPLELFAAKECTIGRQSPNCCLHGLVRGFDYCSQHPGEHGQPRSLLHQMNPWQRGLNQSPAGSATRRRTRLASTHSQELFIATLPNLLEYLLWSWQSAAT